MKPNLAQHPCKNKCTDFKEEQCKTCLVRELPSIQNYDSDFLPGDVVVLTMPHYTTDSDELFDVEEFHSNLEMYSIESASHLLQALAEVS